METLAPQRDLSYSPLFQVMLALNSTLEPVHLPGVVLQPAETETGAALFDILLAARESPDGVRIGWEYDRDLFDRERIERMAAHLAGLLEAGLADPDRPVSELPLLTEAERHQILTVWNDTDFASPDFCLHDLVEAQIERTPDAVALVGAAGKTWTYAELGERAGRVAALLRSLGIGPEVPVGVSMSRTPALVAALLGVLKAGGTYVPLDPGYPRERLAFLLEDTGAPVVLTEEAIRPRLPETAGRVVCLDREELPVGDTGSGATPGNLAYLIYTSGSTGRPKGVAIEHRSAVAFAHWSRRVFSDEELNGVFAATSVNFDLSVFELFVPLCWGGRVILGENALALADHPAAGEVRLLNTVPSAMAELLRLRAVPPSVRTVNLAGEPLRRSLAEQIFELGTVERLLDLYGPSEDTTYSTWAPVDPAEDREPTIGRPLLGTRLYLLDRHGQPVPVGVPGELHLGGAGLARGYLGRPDLTAEKFVPDSFQGAGERLYRTGDLARFLPDGRVEYLGRIDHQVKVRGFRIELGEIESALLKHPAVREAAVLALGDGADRHLVGYVAGTADHETLRAHLRATLPESMIPSLFVFLDALPLTPNGKVDRKALVRVQPAAARLEGVFVAPRTQTEEKLARIWTELLGLERVGIDEDFFGLGGHSLLGTRLVFRAREAFGVELPLRVVFEARTVAALAARVDEILVREGRTSAPPIRPHTSDEEETLPLSFSQERLWFLDLLTPEQAVYNIPVALHFSGRLDLSALAAALDEIVRRHETLRTTFPSGENGPRQHVHPFWPGLRSGILPLDLADLDALPTERRDPEARRLLAEGARRSFDLRQGPVMRAQLLRLDEDQAYLLLNLHHIVSDGWSMGVLIDEITTLYAAFTAGRPSPLPELPVQYADFALWQRKWLRGAALERQLDWWLGELAGAPMRLELQTDRPRPAVQRFRGEDLKLYLPPALETAVYDATRRHGVTLFMLAMTAFEALLHRYTGQDDILVGSPIANRGRSELEGLIGFFVNTLVLRGRFKDVTFAAALDGIRTAALGGYSHQDLPFERLVEQLAPERNLSHSPIFQVMLLVNAAPPGAELPGMTVSAFELDLGAAKFDLLLALEQNRGGLETHWNYDRDLFDSTRIARMAGHFAILLEAALADPDRPVADLPLLTEAERRQLLEWNSTAADYIGEPCLHELVEAQARRTPDAVAVSFEGAELTYRELDERAGRLARRLRAAGVGMDRMVGISAERSLEMVVGLLGILKSGGAYVPIDPALPADRVAYMLADSGVPVLLTQSHLRERLPETGARVLLLDDEPAPDLPLGRTAEPDSLAYMIYTSGSTGRPKGAMNRHWAIRNRLLWLQDLDPLTPADRVMQKTPYSFDVSVWEFFWPLVTGARLVVAKPGGHQDPAYLIDLIEREGITTLHFVPSMLRVFLEAPGLERCGPVRRVICSGEALPADLERQFCEGVKNARLLNLYGPTEAAVEVTWWTCGQETSPLSVPIGRPVANTAIHLVDRHFHRVPVGVPGELLIAGLQPARGYHGRPELTAEKFIPDPFSTEPGARMYRTGDLSRYRPDGAIEYLGRIDFQVKIRGFRIELGEIESALCDHEDVKDAVVTATGRAGEQRLVAYVVPPVSAETLRGALRERLPEYMVPSTFVFLDALPLNPNGKVDRKALPQPETVAAGVGERVEPRTELERFLAGLWREVLRVDRIGVHDSFFALGGSSISGAILINRLQRALGEPVPVVALFEAPTLAELAGWLGQRYPEALAKLGGEKSAEAMIPRLERGPDAETPISFSQERLWFLDQLEPGNPFYDVFAPLRLTGELNVPALRATVSEIVRRHEILRSTFGGREGRPFQRVAPFGEILLPVVDLRGIPGTEAEALRLTAEEGRWSFDLARGPVFKVSLLRLGEASWILLFNMHHIVSDLWSIGVLVDELAAFYDAFCRRAAPELPELPIQYADFAVWQRAWLEGARMETEIDWWRAQLAGAPPLLALPTDRPRPSVQSFRGTHLDVQLSKELSDGLAALSQSCGATLFMTLLAAFDLVLHRASGQTDLVVGSPIASRNRSEIEGLIGCFINTLALRSRLDGDSLSFRDLLGRVRATVLDAFTHQDVPFERIVDSLQLPRTLSHNPVFQVLFALQNAPVGTLELGGVALEMVDLPTTTAVIDLSLGLREGENGIWGAFLYSTDLFDATTMDWLLARYRETLEWAVAAPDRPLSELPRWTMPKRNHAGPAAVEETDKEEVLRARLAARQDGVEEMRSSLSDRKRAALEKLIRGRARPT